jgi:hypothetical protein
MPGAAEPTITVEQAAALRDRLATGTGSIEIVAAD